MKNFIRKLKNFLKKKLALIEHKKELINIVLTFMLIVVSLFMIIITIRSYETAEKISDIQIYLHKEQEKQTILNHILFAKNLLEETKWNEDEIKIILKDMRGCKSNNKFRRDYIRTSYIENAINMIDFGNQTMRMKFDNYLLILKEVKEDLADIQEHYKANSKIKGERIDDILFFGGSILKAGFENFQIYTFYNDIEKYIEYQTMEYEEINSLLKNN